MYTKQYAQNSVYKTMCILKVEDLDLCFEHVKTCQDKVEDLWVCTKHREQNFVHKKVCTKQFAQNSLHKTVCFLKVKDLDGCFEHVKTCQKKVEDL